MEWNERPQPPTREAERAVGNDARSAAVTTDTARRDPVTLVLEEGVPVRMDWNGARYYPVARPVPRGRMQFTHDEDTPFPALVTGWQLDASSVDGDRHVFIVISGYGGRWWLTSLDP